MSKTKTVTIGGLPVYNATIDGDADGMLIVSLVDYPAVMSDFQAFAGQKARQLYAVQDEDKRIVRGVVMRADFPIYRRDDTFGEYYIIYTAETIRQMAEKYLAEDRANLVNLMHEEGSEVEGVQMVQFFLKDAAAGVSPDGFDDIADGSLFAEYHITNDDVWAQVKDGTFRGFSLEGYFGIVPVPEEERDEVADIVRDLNGAFRKTENYFKNQTFMSKIDRIKAAIARLLATFGNVTTDKGVIAWDGEEDLKEGDTVYVEDADGNRTTPADGDYITADGKTITVADGKVSGIADPKAEVADEFGAVETDTGTLHWDGDEDLTAGTDVFQEDAEGNRSAAADGEYKTEDGKVIVVVDGKVAEIKDPEAEVAPTDVDARRERFARIRAAFDESYAEKEQAIITAIVALGYADFYLAEAGDDFAVIAVWSDEEGEKFTRFTISWNEDGTANAAEAEEVEPAFVPVEEGEPAAQEVDVEELRRQVADLTAQLAAAMLQPAAKPAHEEVQTGAAIRETGNKGLDRLARMMRK